MHEWDVLLKGFADGHFASFGAFALAISRPGPSRR
jgi:hypothetical protein